MFSNLLPVARYAQRIYVGVTKFRDPLLLFEELAKNVGVSFFRSLDSKRVQTSVAQVFNERGEGVILRGGDAEPISRDPKDDRQAHLSEENMRLLIKDVLAAYRSEHKHAPPRVVIHKTSSFNKAERDGCHAALDELNIEHRDLLVVSRSITRLFRVGQ